MNKSKIYYEGQVVHAQEVAVTLLKNQSGRALLDVSGEKTKLVYVYIRKGNDGVSVYCYKKRLNKRELNAAIDSAQQDIVLKAR